MDSASKNKLTINKVAELCGVSKTTISRFLNGKYDNMSQETRDRIEEVISRLDFRPDRTAQRLKSQKSMLIGCVIADAGSPFSALLLKGIASMCEHAGYQVLFSDSQENPIRERRAIEDFINSRVDGLLINTTGENSGLLKELNEKLPVVLVDRLIEGGDIDSVSSPNYETSCNVTRRLLEMGYENIAVVSEKLKHISPRVDRFRGYSDVVSGAGIVPSLYETSSDRDVFGCMEFLREFSAANFGKRIAVICTNGVAAFNVILAAQELGIEMGPNFGCITFDDWLWLKLSEPHVSAVNLATEEKGYKAAELLVKRINGDEIPEDMRKIEVPVKIKYRTSTVPGSSAT